MPPSGLALVFAVAFASGLAAVAAVELGPRARARRRLERLRAERAEGVGRAAASPARARGRAEAGPAGGGRAGMAGQLTLWLARIRRDARAGAGTGPARGILGRTERRLRRAALRLRAVEFLALQALAAAVGATAGAALLPPAAGAVAGAASGWLLPSLYVERRIRWRRRAASAQLPDALSLMAGALRSGYPFLQALETVAREMPDPLSGELAQVVRETRVGIALEDALANLLDRVGGRDLDLVVTAVLIQQEVGGNLAEVLDTIAETVRERVRIQGQVRALTAQGRLSGWIVGLLPVGIAGLMLLLHPDYLLALLDHPLGWLLLGGAAAGELLGALAIRQIVRVEV